MWLYTPEFFVSLVDNREDYPGSSGYHVTARFRREQHANAFCDLALKVMSDLPRDEGVNPLWHVGPLLHTPGRDYQFRLYVSRELLALMTTHLVEQRLIYPNFKDNVDDPRDHRTYGLVWGVTNELADQ